MLVFNFLILALADTSVRFTLKSPTSKRALYEISSSSFGLIVNLPTTSDSFSLRPEPSANVLTSLNLYDWPIINVLLLPLSL